MLIGTVIQNTECVRAPGDAFTRSRILVFYRFCCATPLSGSCRLVPRHATCMWVNWSYVIVSHVSLSAIDHELEMVALSAVEQMTGKRAREQPEKGSSPALHRQTRAGGWKPGLNERSMPESRTFSWRLCSRYCPFGEVGPDPGPLWSSSSRLRGRLASSNQPWTS